MSKVKPRRLRKVSEQLFRDIVDFEIKRDFSRINYSSKDVSLNLNFLPKDLYIYNTCVECGGKLVFTTYIGSQMVYEIVCSKCGLVHAVFGSNFYEKQTEEIRNKIVSGSIKQNK